MAHPPAMTLLEMTVVIAVLMMLVSATMVGARTWRRGGDRATCLLDIRHMQVSVRSYQNLYGYGFDSRPQAENGTQDISRQLLAKGYIEPELFRKAQGNGPCAGGGHYSRPHPDIFPQQGRLYMSCSLEVADAHAPAAHDDW